MASKFSVDTPLGKQIPAVSAYAPALLCAIPRAETRLAWLAPGAGLPFVGRDVWHAYEVSWLDQRGKPQVAVARFDVPCDSPCLIESKSLKLYLNSLNQSRFRSAGAVSELIARDLSAAAGAGVRVALCGVAEAALLQPGAAQGESLDGLDVAADVYLPDAGLLTAAGAAVSEQLYTELFRSLCPVTGQPDWATVVIGYRGPAIERAGLLRYLISFREHAGFHEQCVERIFVDVSARCRPESLSVRAHFLRRGGLDINPCRSSAPEVDCAMRLLRQ